MHTGVSFCRTVVCEDNRDTRGSKVWICQYTCCIVRALQSDVVTDMMAKAFIRSFKRFVTRRGFLQRFISGNVKTFKSTAKTIRAVMNHPKIQQHFTRIGMEYCHSMLRGFHKQERYLKERCDPPRDASGIQLAKLYMLSYDELLTAVIDHTQLKTTLICFY